MHKNLKPVSIGLVLGTIGLFFGIFWAMYLVVNHENIHKALSDGARESFRQNFVINEAPSQGHDGHGGHEAHSSHGHSHSTPADTAAQKVNGHEGHDDPAMEAAHERLTRGHLHAMGLGTITILFSLLLSFLDAPPKLKTIASACIGTGGLFYPLAWIVMGYRTAALGIDAAQESVMPIVAVSVPLVLLGLFITVIYILKGIFSSK